MLAKILNAQIAQCPYTWADFVADNNNTNYGTQTDILTLFPQTDTAAQGYTCVTVQDTALPALDPIRQNYREVDPELVNGTWQRKYEIYDLTAEEIAANEQASQKRLYDSIVSQTQNRLDAFAREHEFDDIHTASSYRDSAITRFRTDGQYCYGAREQTWEALYTILDEVKAGTRPVPTSFSDIEPELPTLEWPQ